MKQVVLALMVVAMMAMVANATSPPAPPSGGGGAGWGMTWYDWDNYTGSYSSGLALYDPIGGSGGFGWVVEWNPTQYITYAPITLELWIEMYLIQTYQYTSYQWHRLGNSPANSIAFTIDGTIQSNEALWVSLTEMDGWDPLGLEFQHNIGVGDNQNVRSLIPISWRARWGEGLVVGSNPSSWGWITLTWSGNTPDRLLTIPDLWSGMNCGSFPACDH